MYTVCQLEIDDRSVYKRHYMAARTPTKKPETAEETLSETALIRLSPTEKAVFLAFAKKDTRSLSSWMRLVCIQHARSLGAKI